MWMFPVQCWDSPWSLYLLQNWTKQHETGINGKRKIRSTRLGNYNLNWVTFGLCVLKTVHFLMWTPISYCHVINCSSSLQVLVFSCICLYLSSLILTSYCQIYAITAYLQGCPRVTHEYWKIALLRYLKMCVKLWIIYQQVHIFNAHLNQFSDKKIVNECHIVVITFARFSDLTKIWMYVI